MVPKIPKLSVQGVFTAVIYAVVVGGVFLAAKKGASMVGGSVESAVNKVADLAGQ